jgi:pre-mRNA cleavage complex 2 protein Pcf11
MSGNTETRTEAGAGAGAGAEQCVSPAQFGQDYYNSLRELTFNSRPIIESHTTLAQENSQFSAEIVAAIERRIEKAIPSQKLFALYLLDSITKNIGLPYTTLFSHNLFKTFTQTYGLVDDATRCKLIKLFKTWKVPTAMTGMPLFDANQLNKIEQFLIKVTNATNANGNGGPGMNSNTPTPNSGTTPLNTHAQPRVNSKAVLITEVDQLLSLVNARLQSVPTDEKGQQRFKLLNQLKAIISSKSAIPQAQLDEVAKQLQTIRDDEIMKLNIIKQQQQQQQQQQSLPFSASQLQSLLDMNKTSTPMGGTTQMPAVANTQALYNMMNSVLSKSSNSNTNSNSNTVTPMQTPPPAVTLSPPSANPLGLKNISFLENILKKSANKNIDNNNNNNTSSATAPRVDFNFIKPTKEAILEDFTLTQSFINHHNPNSKEISLLYDFKSIQCTECSKRFTDDESGLVQRRKHNEWHRRVEQRMKGGGSGLGGVVNRSWYLTENEWVEFNYDDDDDENDVSGNGNNNNINNNNKGDNSKDTGRGKGKGKGKNDHHVMANTSVRITGGVTDTGDNGKEREKERDREEKIDLKDAPNHIVRIPESSNNEVVCGICRDTIVGVFDEDSGDWVWKNAVEARSRVWHWTCWMEAKMRRKREMSPTRAR